MKSKYIQIFVLLMLIASIGTVSATPLLHKWSFDSNTIDSVSGINGVIIGNNTNNFLSGKSGNALYTNRTLLTFADLGYDDVSYLTDFTIDLYIKPDEGQEKCYDPIENFGNYGILASANDYWSSSTWSWQLRYGAPIDCNLGWQVNLASGLQWVQMPYKLPTTQYSHITMIFRQGTSLELYDGTVLVDIKTFPATTILTNPLNRLLAGCDGWCSYGTLYSGYQDELKINQYALSQNEIVINNNPVTITPPPIYSIIDVIWSFLRSIFPFLKV